MFDTEQSDTFCAEADGFLCVIRVIGVCADTHLAVFIHELHELLEAWVLCCVDSVDAAFIDIAFCSVEADDVAFFEGLSAYCYSAFLLIDVYVLAANDAAFSPSAGN